MSDIDGIEALGQFIEAVGISEFLASFTTYVQTGAIQPNQVPTSLLPLVRLFSLGEAVPVRQLTGMPESAMCELEELGFAARDADAWYLPYLVLVRAHGLWLLVERPSATRRLYFGNDSLALAARIPQSSGKALDLCSGPGFQSLYMAARGLAVTACEINPTAVRLSEVNARLNCLGAKFHAVLSDLYANLPVQEFDLIVANPPMVAVPKSVPYPFVGDGGPDGMSVITRIMDDLPRFLRPAGVAHTLGVTAAHREFPLGIDEELGQRAMSLGLLVRMTLIHSQSTTSTSRWIHTIAMTSLAFQGKQITPAAIIKAAKDVSREYTVAGADSVVFFFMQITKNNRPRLELFDLRPELSEDIAGWCVA